MDAMECLRTRRSVRQYTDEPVSRETIESIVDVGRLAATGMNGQPWHFVVVTDSETRRKLAEITEYGKFIAKAPVAIAVFSDDVKYFIEDCSAAIMNMLNAAWACGLGSCWVAGDKKPYVNEIRDLLGAPDTVKLVGIVVAGHAAGESTPIKKSLADVIHWERF